MVVKFPRWGSLYTVSALRPFGRSGGWLADAELPVEFVVVLLLQTRIAPEVEALRRSLDDGTLSLETVDDLGDHGETFGSGSVRDREDLPNFETHDQRLSLQRVVLPIGEVHDNARLRDELFARLDEGVVYPAPRFACTASVCCHR